MIDPSPLFGVQLRTTRLELRIGTPDEIDELAFRGLGAVAATSGWLEGNHSSARVSEKLGYVETGTGEISPRGVPVPHHDLRLERERWISPLPVEISGLEPALSLFGAA